MYNVVTFKNLNKKGNPEVTFDVLYFAKNAIGNGTTFTIDHDNEVVRVDLKDGVYNTTELSPWSAPAPEPVEEAVVEEPAVVPAAVVQDPAAESAPETPAEEPKQAEEAKVEDPAEKPAKKRKK